MRLFAALYPPPEAAANLLAQLSPLDLPAGRATLAEQLHLTLVFIGDTPPRDLPDVRESVERSCSGVEGFSLRAEELVTIPDNPAPPRIVAARTDAPAGLLEIQRRLATRLARPRRSGKPDRFDPHLTLWRFPEGTRGGPFGGHIEPVVFHVEHVRLMSSRLRLGGSVHEEIMRVTLE